MAISGYGHLDKDRQKLLSEIAKLKEAIIVKDAEIKVLTNRLALYKSLI